MRRILLLAVGFALLLTAVAFAKATNYIGLTSQVTRLGNLRISLTVENGKVKQLSGRIGYPNCNGNIRFVNLNGPISIKMHKFNGTLKGSPKVTISGTFSGKTVTGSFTSSVKLGQRTCASGKVTYTLSK